MSEKRWRHVPSAEGPSQFPVLPVVVHIYQPPPVVGWSALASKFEWRKGSLLW
jgi:hypothetical protein